MAGDEEDEEREEVKSEEWTRQRRLVAYQWQNVQPILYDIWALIYNPV